MYKIHTLNNTSKTVFSFDGCIYEYKGVWYFVN